MYAVEQKDTLQQGYHDWSCKLEYDKGVTCEMCQGDLEGAHLRRLPKRQDHYIYPISTK